MGRTLLIAIAMMATFLLCAGCGEGSVKVRYPTSWEGYGEPPPPATIAPADPNSTADLSRENSQLKDRIAWLEDRIRKADSDYKKKQREIEDIKADIAKTTAERDRYKRAAGN